MRGLQNKSRMASAQNTGRDISNENNGVKRMQRPTPFEQAIIGLATIAIAHIDNDDFDKARNTLLGLIMQLEGTQEREQ